MGNHLGFCANTIVFIVYTVSTALLVDTNDTKFMGIACYNKLAHTNSDNLVSGHEDRSRHVNGLFRIHVGVANT
jgi:hypothetical protein